MIRNNNFTLFLGPITVQRGWWFSSHEQWKFLELPYLDVPISKRVFINGEKVRTINSNAKKIPGKSILKGIDLFIH